MRPDDEWERWAADFRHSPAPRALDVDALVAKAGRDTWKHRASMILELVGYASQFVFFGFLVQKEPSVWPLASAVCAAFAVAMAYTFHARRGTWAQAGADVASYVALATRRKRSDVRLARFGQWLLGALSLAVAVWLPWFLARTPDRLAGTWLAAPVRVAFCVAVLVGAALYLRWKLEKETAALRRLEALLEGVGGGAP